MLAAEGDVNAVAYLVIIPAAELGGDLVAHRVAVADMAVDQGVHAQVLVGEDVHGDLAAADHVLGTHAQVDLLAGVGQQHALFFLGELHAEAVAFQLPFPDGDVKEVHGRQADEACHKAVGRGVIELQRRAHLLDMAHGHADDAVRQGQGFGLVVGNVEHGGLQALVQQQDLPAGGAAELGVQVAEGLVEEEDLGVADDGAAHGHTLSLAAGKLRGLLVQLAGQAQDLGRGQHLLVDHIGIFLAQRQGKGHVFIDGHVSVQGIVLEHHGHVAVFGRGLGDVLAVQEQVAGGDILQACDHAQGGGLAAAGGTDQDDQLAVLDVQIEVIDCLNVIVVDLVYMLYFQLCHNVPSFMRPGRSETPHGPAAHGCG